MNRAQDFMVVELSVLSIKLLEGSWKLKDLGKW